MKESGATPAGPEPTQEAIGQLKAGAAAALSQILADEEQKKASLAQKAKSSSD